MKISIQSFFVKIIVLHSICVWGISSEWVQFPSDQASVVYEAETKMQSDRVAAGSVFPIQCVQMTKGILSLSDQKPHFPVPLQFNLEEFKMAVQDDYESSSHSLNDPGQIIDFNELLAFRGKPMSFSIINTPPFVQIPDSVLQRYGNLKIFQNSILKGFLSHDLYSLFTIVNKPIPVGEGFTTKYEKDDLMKYAFSKTFVIKESTPEKLVVEVLYLIERQRITFPSGQEVVIHGDSKAIWEINRSNGMLFQVYEKGTLTHAMRIDGIESVEKHFTERTVKTSLITQSPG